MRLHKYDLDGRRTAQTDALGNTTRWEYAENSAHPTGFITPKGEETDYTYDRVGRRMSISNAYGTVAGNRLMKVSGWETEVYQYNAKNRLTSLRAGDTTIQYCYDPQGNLLEERGTRGQK